MSKFITNIQLFEADASDYLALHTALLQENFVLLSPKTANSQASVSNIHTYALNDYKSIREVINTIFTVTKSVGRKYSFTVMKDKYGNQ